MKEVKVKIYGAGSIGNHLAQACRRADWQVAIVDPDPEALERTKEVIYPSRYGKWDPEIELFELGQEPKGDFDVIFLGMPPNVRMSMALEVLDEEPRVLQLEKPICTPELLEVKDFLNALKKSSTTVVTGYDHIVSRLVEKAEKVIKEKALGVPQSLDVEFREHWGGIFNAHSWLSGPQDSYLGFWRKGGGASGEHSHATNLWQHFAHVLGLGRVVEVSACLQMVKTEQLDYDQSYFASLKTEEGFVGRVVQDVLRKPALKMTRIQFPGDFLECRVNYDPHGDALITSDGVEILAKRRPDDFFREILHIDSILKGDIDESAISLERGLDTMMVIAAAHRSHVERRTIKIDWSKGYTLEALN